MTSKSMINMRLLYVVSISCVCSRIKKKRKKNKQILLCGFFLFSLHTHTQWKLSFFFSVCIFRSTIGSILIKKNFLLNFFRSFSLTQNKTLTLNIKYFKQQLISLVLRRYFRTGILVQFLRAVFGVNEQILKQ